MSLRHCDADRVAGYTSSFLSSENNFKVRGFCYIEEVLGVAAPELVLSASIMHSLATSCHLIPLACKSLLNRLG